MQLVESLNTWQSFRNQIVFYYYRYLQKDNVKCSCCNHYVNKQEINLYRDHIDLGFLGVGFPMFFNFIIFCLLLLLFKAFIQSIGEIYINANSNFCTANWYEQVEMKQGIESCPSQFWNLVAYPNAIQIKSGVFQDTYLQQVLGIEYISRVLYFICSILLILVFKRQQKSIYNHIDLMNITPSDYSILLQFQNYPKKTFISRVLQKIQISFPKAPIPAKVIPIYNFSQIYQLHEKLHQNRQKLMKVLQKNKGDFKSQEVLDLNNQFISFKQKPQLEPNIFNQNPENQIGMAILIFNTQIEKFQFLNLNNEQISYQDQKLILTMIQAPEPSDINWEYIHCSSRERIISYIKSWTLTFLVLIVCFLFILGILVLKTKAYDKAQQNYSEIIRQQKSHFSTDQKLNQKQKTAKAFYILANFTVWLVTLIIFFFNKFALGTIIHKIVDQQKLKTISDIQVHFSRKFTWTLFFTTALMTLTVDGIIFKNIYQSKGVIQLQSSMYVINSILPPLIWLINPWYLLKKYQRSKYYRKTENITQEKANELMQNPPYFMGKRYSDIMKTMWFTFFFSRVIPVGVILSFFGLCAYYWVDKYNLLRKFTVKQNISKKVAYKMSEFLEFIVLWAELGNIFFKFRMGLSIQVLDWVLLGVAFIFTLIRLQYWIKIIFGEPKQTHEHLPYDLAKKHFVQRYEDYHPTIRK